MTAGHFLPTHFLPRQKDNGNCVVALSSKSAHDWCSRCCGWQRLTFLFPWHNNTQPSYPPLSFSLPIKIVRIIIALWRSNYQKLQFRIQVACEMEIKVLISERTLWLIWMNPKERGGQPYQSPDPTIINLNRNSFLLGRSEYGFLLSCHKGPNFLFVRKELKGKGFKEPHTGPPYSDGKCSGGKWPDSGRDPPCCSRFSQLWSRHLHQ